MRPLSIVISALAIAVPAAFAVRVHEPPSKASAAAAIPLAHAGEVFTAWLTAFNTGDRARIESFYQTYWPQASPSDPDIDLRLRHSTGGLDVASISHSEPTHFAFTPRNRSDHHIVIGETDVTGTNPPHVAQLPLDPVGTNARVIGFQIDASVRARVVRAVATKLEQLYVIPDAGKQMARDITARWKRGEYDSITDGWTFIDPA